MADENQTNQTNAFVELGSTGLTRFGGWVYEEWLRDLQGQQGIKVYKEMRDNDPVVGAFLFAIEMLLRQTSWRVEAASDDNKDQEAADFLESCLYDMSTSWHDTITEIISMLVFGWSYHELVYKRRMGDSQDPTKRSKYTDGRIGWRKIPIRAQETLWKWLFDDEGGIQGLEQLPPPDYQLRTVPIGKALLFRTKTNLNNPEGRSILRNAYRPWFFKKNIEEIEGIGIERDLAGLPVAQVPPELLSPNATTDQKAVLTAIKTIVTSIRRDEMEGIVFPSEFLPNGNKSGYKLDLLSAGAGGGRRNFDTSAIITRYDQRIAMTVMADFILLGHEKVGSFALSSSKTELFSMALGAYMDSIRDVFNTHAVPRLFALNSFQGITELPRLEHGDVESPNLKELGDYITTLSGAGATLFPDDQLENYLREAASLPEKTEPQPAQPPEVAKRQQDEFTEAVRELREAVRKAVGHEPEDVGSG